MAKENVTVLNINTEKANVSLRDLRKELRNLKDDMLSAEKGTEEYTVALERASEIQTTITNLNREVRKSFADTEDIIKTTASAAAGLTAGMGALKGITTLVGGENSNATKALEQMMSYMSIAQGLRGIGGMITSLKNFSLMLKTSATATKAMSVAQKAFNFIMNLNPIFLLVTILAAVVAGIMAFTKAIGISNKANEEANKILEKQKDLRESNIEKMEFEIEVMKIMGATQKEIINQMLDNNEELYEQNEQHIKELEKLLLQGGLKKKKRKEIQEQLDNLKKDNEDILNENKKLNRDLKLDAIKQEKETSDAKLKEQEKYLQEKQKLIDKEKAMLREFYLGKDSEIDLVNKKYIELLRLARKYGEDETAISIAYVLENQNIFKKATDERLKERAKQIAEEADMLDAYSDESREKLLDDLEFEIDAMVNQNQTIVDLLNKRINNEEDASEERKEIEEAYVQHMSQMNDAIAGLLMASSRIAEKESKLQKTLAVGATLISTYQAAQQAYLSAFQPVATVASPALGAISAATALATGLSNVKRILSVGGKGGSVGATPSITTPSRPNNISSIVPIKDVGNQNKEINVRAYVVESELNKAVSNTQKIKSETEF